MTLLDRMRRSRVSDGPWRTLVIVAHPSSDSFTHAVAEAAVSGLRSAGHDVEVLDLYADGFRPAMSLEERRAYETDDPLLDPLAREHAELVRRADHLVFVYPTWWSGLPAILKGWLERVLVTGVAFHFDERTNKIRPGLAHIRWIVGISTYGSRRRYVRSVNDNGRRIILRALWLACGLRTRRTWLALYAIDTSTDEQRAAFIRRVSARMAAIS